MAAAAHAAALSSRLAVACWTARDVRSCGMPGMVASILAKRLLNSALTLCPLLAETCNRGVMKHSTR